MRPTFFANSNLRLAAAGILLAAKLFAADTNAVPAAPVPPPLTREDLAGNYLQIQEQIHAAQLAIEEAQAGAAAVARTNAGILAGRLDALESAVAAQRASDAEAARKTQQLTLFLAGAFGLAGLGIMLLMVYFQWRAFTQLADMTAQHHALLSGNGPAQGLRELAAPSRATVETANAHLLDAVGRLEKRLQELEDAPRLLPGAAAPADPLAGAQKALDAGQAQAALDAVEKFLAAHPQHAGALVKKAAALEKLGRLEEALACCDRALAADSTLAVAHLHKGGLLNRLRRYDEALNCFEQALHAQEKQTRP